MLQMHCRVRRSVQIRLFRSSRCRLTNPGTRVFFNSSSGLGPLLIVDGLQVDNIQYLDPQMIRSMEVLKDAASAAIYGT